MRTRSASSLMLIGLLLIPLTGCWNSRELRDLSIIGAIGIDKLPDKPGYKVSFQIINPSAVAMTGNGGGGSQAGMPVTVYTGTGSSIFEVIRKTSRLSPRQLFFSHIRLIVIGETLASEDLSHLFDFFERSHEVRLTTKLVVSRGSSAEQLLQVLTPLERIPSDAVYGKLESTESIWSESMVTGVDDVINRLIGPGKQLLISGVRILGDQDKGGEKANLDKTKLPAEIEIKGIALFKNGRLETWLDGGKARGALRIQDKMKSSVVTVPCKDHDDPAAIAAIEITRSRTKVKATVVDGEPAFRVYVREEGNVGEVSCAVDLSKKEAIEELEQRWRSKTKQEIREAIEAAQSRSSDVYGFGEVLNRSYPRTWKKLEDRWSEVFADCEIEVHVESFIRRSGMRTKPYIKE
jgi:germination protein, Ger(x)C family